MENSDDRHAVRVRDFVDYEIRQTRNGEFSGARFPAFTTEKRKVFQYINGLQNTGNYSVGYLWIILSNKDTDIFKVFIRKGENSIFKAVFFPDFVFRDHFIRVLLYIV